MDDIRWKQRFRNFEKALSQLSAAVELANQRPLSPLEEQGLIQAFEFTHELAWNVMKDYIAFQGNESIAGSRDATREAFKIGLVVDGDGWMEMIKSRNQTTHTYNEGTAQDIAQRVVGRYFALFDSFLSKMNTLARDA